MASDRPSASSPQSIVSKQMTKTTVVSSKLEWNIQQFLKLTKLMNNTEGMISKRFSSPQAPNVLWELHIYPNGKRDVDINHVSLFLRQVGLQETLGFVRTGFQIYALNDKNERVSICRDTKDFMNQQGRGKFQLAADKFAPVLHQNGSILLVCELEFLLPSFQICTEFQVKACEGFSHPQENFLSAANREMWENELFTDCEIQVGRKTFLAHRCFLGQHSNVFRSMFSQSIMLEAKNRKLIITDADPLHFHALLEFIYTGSIRTDRMETYAEGILSLADKYAIVFLKQHCELYLASKIDVGNVLQTVVAADAYFASILRKACVHFISENVAAILCSSGWKKLKESRTELVNEIRRCAQ